MRALTTRYPYHGHLTPASPFELGTAIIELDTVEARRPLASDLSVAKGAVLVNGNKDCRRDH
ncbi:MAG: hypothetical protein GEU91_07465 [Rhizobiales bacterium]|nr:hypothetical protein [Hyphomicrobiales bacterium]